MPFDSIVTIIAAIVTVVGTIAGVVIANRLTSTRSFKEKVWEIRREAYGLILSELVMIERICDSADEHIEEDHDRYFETVEQKDTARINKHWKAIDKRIADDYLILSDEFIALFDEMRKAMATNPYDHDPPEEHATFSTAIRKYRPRLIALAKGEMTIP